MTTTELVKQRKELIQRIEEEKVKHGYLDALNDLADYADKITDATILQAFIDAISELKKKVE